jgi:hypothetical protein
MGSEPQWRNGTLHSKKKSSDFVGGDRRAKHVQKSVLPCTGFEPDIFCMEV